MHSEPTAIPGEQSGSYLSGRLRYTIGFMAISGVAISAAVILCFNLAVDDAQWSQIGSRLELMAVTLMPYMISAAVAAITAVGIVAILPWIKLPDAMEAVRMRLREMAVGDLSSRVQLRGGNQQARQLARELNSSLGELSGLIARWKVLDRTQWDLLESVRMAATRKDHDDVIRQIEMIEKNFERIGELHERLIT